MTLILALVAVQAQLVKKTYTYKQAGPLRIELDVYRPEGDAPRRVLVWIHGGALLMGGRGGVPRNLLDLCRDEGFALVSIDYRLAPHVKLPEIVSDVRDALGWVRGPESRLDSSRLVVAGGSAGGYLTLMTGLWDDPRPSALVAYWGYGDVDGDWYTKPSEFYRKSMPLIAPQDALAGLSPATVTSPPDSEQGRARQRYYHYLRQNGLWTREVTGFDPEKDRSKLDPFCPVRNVTPAYPSTLLVHGTEDTDVPYELSAAMARELARHGVRHELVTVPGAGHGLARGDKPLVDAAHARALAFIKDHLR